jgi:uncharacterized membrane protein YfcA
MSWIEIASLLVAACAAGAVNAVAGGGTLLTFPTLILFGVPPIIANATSTLALLLGMAGSLYGYRKHLSDVKPWFTTFIPVSIAGGWIGSLLLTRSSERVFTELVPYLVLFATVLFMLQGVLSARCGRQLHASDSPTSRRPHLLAALFFQFLVSIYGGYFGAGIGILMLATLGFMGFRNIHQMNTLKSVLGSLINLVAAAWFTASGLIDWPRMAIMTVGAFAGYYVASTYCQRLPQKAVRRLIAIIGLVITAVMFWKL